MTVELTVPIKDLPPGMLNLPGGVIPFRTQARVIGDASAGFARINWVLNDGARNNPRWVWITHLTATLYEAGGTNRALHGYVNMAAWPDYQVQGGAGTHYMNIGEPYTTYADNGDLDVVPAMLVRENAPIYLGQTAKAVDSIVYAYAEINPTASGYLYSTIGGYYCHKPFLLPKVPGGRV